MTGSTRTTGSPRPAGSYGIDAPWVPWLWLGLCALYVVLAFCAPLLWGAPWWVGLILAVIAAGFAGGAAVYWHSTRRGKFAVWDELLVSLDASLPAAARVLDLGCGRGAVAVQTALRFPDSTVTGIDLWRSIDQSGNGIEVAQANAVAAGVAERICFVTGDMTELPFPDGSFDLVTASLSIHNIPTAAGRAKAIEEAWRVLAPGGHLLIVDIQHTGEYAAALTGRAGTFSGPTGVGWRMWWSGPWMSTRNLEAVKKPARPAR